MRLGQTLAASLPPGAVVWLEGDLGAGKTTLVRSITAGRGVSLAATSPTFSLVHRYDGPRGPVFHVDCYRLRSPAEAAELHWEEMEAGDLLLIEWPERGGAWVAPPTVRIRLAHVPDVDRREVTVTRLVAEAP